MAGQITMNNQPIINATITIEEVIDKGKKLSIKGNDGSRTYTYSVWKTKQDGTDSATYAQFKTMGLGVGQSVFVGYVIDEYDTEIGGVPKRVQSKKIINFREAMGQPVQTPSPAQTPRTEHSGASGGKSDDQYWDKKAYKQCLWNYWLGTDKKSGLSDEDTQKVWFVFKQIQQDAEKRFSQAVTNVPPSRRPAGDAGDGPQFRHLPDIPEIQIGEDIPF